ncbi:MAG: OmpH family outer membrane protein [Bdellovibrionales bacterium]|nr:OmpH family outer membrane protein [Bdellovibrionales bacterium]
MMRKSIVTATLLMSSLALSANAFAMKVGIVNLQRALQETKKGKSAKATLEKEVEEKKKKIDTERSALQKATEEFQKKSAVMSEKARNQKGMEMQQKIAQFQEFVQKSQQEVQGRDSELTKPVLDGLRATVADIAKKHKVDLVFEENTSGMLYSEEKVDLTDDLIKAYDNK